LLIQQGKINEAEIMLTDFVSRMPADWKPVRETRSVRRDRRKQVQNPLFILETAVGREKAVQTIYVHREFLQLVLTLGVMRDC
jgi:hypothetical protein